MDERCIAVYDSGSGGISCLNIMIKRFPLENFIYFSDRNNLPYGDKSDSELRFLIEKKFSSILSFSPKMIVVACNTASTLLRENSLSCPVPVVGILPFIPESGRTALLCTERTAKSDYVARLRRAGKNFDVFALKGLAEKVEGWLFGDEKPDLTTFCPEADLSAYDNISLGCTHYSFLREDLKKVFPDALVVDGTDGMIKKIANTITTCDPARQCGGVYFLAKADEEVFLNIKQ